MIRPQVGNASNEGEQRCVFQPAQAIRRIPYYYQRTKFYASREFLAGLSPFFFPPFFSTYRIDINEEVSRRSIIVSMGPFSRQIKHEFYQVLL